MPKNTIEELIQIALDRKLVEWVEKKGNMYHIWESGIRMALPEDRARAYLKVIIRRAEGRGGYVWKSE